MTVVHLAGTTSRPLRDARSSPAVTKSDDSIADDASEATIDSQDEVGVLPNWDSHYGCQEQLARFNAYSTRPDLLRRLYALEAASGQTTIFQPKWIEGAKDSSLSIDSMTRRMFPAGRVILGVDPARASGSRASWFVVAVVAFIFATNTDPEQRVVLDLFRERGIASVEEQGAIVQRLARAWAAEWCAIEGVAGFGYLPAFCDHTLRLPVKTILTTKADADEIPALADEVARGRWRIPWADARTRRVMGPLVGEMHDFPQGPKDCLMALTFARRVMYETPTKKVPVPSVHQLWP